MAFNGQDFSFEGPLGSAEKNDPTFKKATRGNLKKSNVPITAKHNAPAPLKPGKLPQEAETISQKAIESTNEKKHGASSIVAMMQGEALDLEPEILPCETQSPVKCDDAESDQDGAEHDESHLSETNIARIPSVQNDPIPLVYDKYREAWRLRRGARQNNRKMEEVEWPDKSSVCCWWCCHTFDTVPVPLPVHYDDRYDMFSVRGNFCSWGCAKAYALHNRSPLGNHSELLAMLRRRVEGKCMSIKAALDRSQLSMFGGTLEIKEFRDASSTECKQPMISVKLSVSDYGLRSITQVRDNYETIQTNVNPTPFKDKGRKDMNFTNISISKNEPLKLKRNKPITGNKGKTVLEKVLGISITS